MRDHGKEARERAHSFLDRHHYKGGEIKHEDGGDVSKAAVKRVVKSAISQHEHEEHLGLHTKLKLKSGGKVDGKKSEHRPDRKARGGEEEDREYEGSHMKPELSEETGETEGRARGGGEEKHGGKKGGGHHIGAVNIAIGNPEKEQAAHQQGIQQGLQVGMQKGAMAAHGGGGGPPMAPPHPPMGPPGGAPMAPPPPRPPVAGPPPGAMPPGAGAPPGAMPPRPMGVKDGGEVHVREHHRRKAGGRCD